MKMLLLVFALLMLASVVSAQENVAQDEPLFTLYGDAPIVPHGAADAWDSRYTDPGAVFFHDGKFHMFRNGFKGWPAPTQVGYLTSDDGLNWTEVTEDPVMMSADVPYAGVAALASDGMVLEDGTWVLYFYTWDEMAPGASGVIGRATAPEPTGPWTPDPEPVLLPGSEGSWDDKRVGAPRIVQTEDGYNLYYSAYSSEGPRTQKIGLATSTDGITWTKYDDITTTNAPYAESDPILLPPEGITFVSQPMVEITPDGWAMTFNQNDFSSGAPDMSLNYALSEDGIHWEVKTPFWTKDTVPNSGCFYFTAMEYHDGIYYQYIETCQGDNTEIFVATHEGSLGGM